MLDRLDDTTFKNPWEGDYEPQPNTTGLVVSCKMHVKIYPSQLPDNFHLMSIEDQAETVTDIIACEESTIEDLLFDEI
ncbi:hypothetical protein N9934_03365 [Desulfosarcina sp.]|nr:hypothetical protein [Desulfosarcina sp.]